MATSIWVNSKTTTMLKNYILIAIRSILRNKAISFINIFGLAVSMSVCLLLILIVADQYAYDEFHKKEARINRVITERIQEKQYEWNTATAPFLLSEVLEEYSVVEEVVTLNNKFSGVAGWEQKEIPFRGMYSSEDFFNIFSFPLAHGDPATALSSPNAIVLTSELASKLFGEKEPLNEVVEVENLGVFVVKGVLSDFPGKSHLQFDALATTAFYRSVSEADTTNDNYYKSWHNVYDSYTYFTTKANAKVSDIAQHINSSAAKHYEEKSNFDYIFHIQALDDITPGPLLSNMTGFSLPLIAVYIMLAVAAVVLLAAALNYANLTTARAINRAKEIGVRKVVGARKSHIFGQFMIESVIIAIIAFIFADLIVQFVVPRMNSYFASLGAPFQFEPTPNLYLWFFGFVLVVGLVAGTVPSLFFASTNPLMALKKSVKLEHLGNRMGFARLNIRKALLVIQFAFSIFFVVTVLAFYQQLNYVLDTDHGFNTEQLVTIDLQGVPYESLDAQLTNLSTVSAVGGTSHMPALGTNNTLSVTKNGEEAGFISTMVVAGDYLDVMGFNVLAGNTFPKHMPRNEQYIIVNEAAVNKFDFETNADAVGQSLVLDEVNYQIIGVVKDFHYERLDEEIGPFAFRYNPMNARQFVVKTNNANTGTLIPELEAKWKAVTNRPFNYSFYEDDLKLSYSHFEALMISSGYVTIIIVSISCLGFLGMVIYHIQNRTKEIGIRKALGAKAIDILVVVGKQFLVLILIAFIIGAPLAYFVNTMWLESNTYRFDFGWLTIVSGFLLLFAVLLLTVGSQLYKAMKVNPVDSLRNE